MLIVGVGIGNLAGAFAMPPWLSWLADIIPEKIQGRFWGRREAIISTAIMLLTVPVAVMLDRVGPDAQMNGLLLVFAVATALGIVDVIMHRSIPEPHVPGLPTENVLLAALQPLRDPRFRPWLWFSVAWSLATTVGGAMAGIYMVENLGLSRNFTGGAVAMISLALLGAAVGSYLGGRLVDRFGVFVVLFWGHAVWAALPVFWLLATPETAVLMVGAGSLTGTAAFAAATNASIKFMTRVPDRASRAMYVAVSASLNSIAAGVGALLGGWLLRTLGPAVLVLGVSLGTFHLLFWISLAARFLLVGTLLPRLRRPAIAGSPSPLPTPSTQI